MKAPDYIPKSVLFVLETAFATLALVIIVFLFGNWFLMINHCIKRKFPSPFKKGLCLILIVFGGPLLGIAYRFTIYKRDRIS